MSYISCLTKCFPKIKDMLLPIHRNETKRSKNKWFFRTITLNKTCLEAREAVYSLGIYFYGFDLLIQDTTI